MRLPGISRGKHRRMEMKKILIGLVSGFALIGLAACDGGDGTTTQGIDDNATTQEAPANGGAGDTGGADTGATTTPPPDTGTDTVQ